MHMTLEAHQAVALMLRDFETRQFPQVLDLLDEAASGAHLDAQHQALLDDLLGDIDRAAGLVGDDFELRSVIANLRTCASDLRDEIRALASANSGRSRSITLEPSEIPAV
jgi:hypothetical protein